MHSILADVQFAMASNATVLKGVAHVVKGVETFKTVVFVANTVRKIYKYVNALIELLTFGIDLTFVVVVQMIMTRYWVEMNQCFIKKVNNAPVAVFIARSLNPIAHAAKNVARRHAFAALFVETCASSANAGLHEFFLIS